MSDNEEIELIKYNFEIDSSETNDIIQVKAPDDSGIVYNIQIRFHDLTKFWYCKITQENNGNKVCTEWKRIVLSPCLNYEYQNVMSYAIGCESNLTFDPETEDSFDMGLYKFYLTSWEDLMYIINDYSE